MKIKSFRLEFRDSISKTDTYSTIKFGDGSMELEGVLTKEQIETLNSWVILSARQRIAGLLVQTGEKS